MYSSRSTYDAKEFLEDGKRQSNVPHFDILEDADGTGSLLSGNGPKQTNVSAHFSGWGTLSRSKQDAFGCSIRSLGGSKAREDGESCHNGRDVLDALFEERHRLADPERNISQEDQCLAQQGRSHPSIRRHGVPHPHEQSRLSTEGSFHLSHLEGDSVSEGSDDMEDFSGSDNVHVSSGRFQRTPLYSHSSPDPQARLRRSNGNRHGNPSKYDGLSWQQYKALATRRKEAQNHAWQMNIDEEINGRSHEIPENRFNPSEDINQDESTVHHEPDVHQRRFSFDRSTEQRSPSPLTRSALNTFQGHSDQSKDYIQHSHSSRMSTFVDPVMNDVENHGFQQQYLGGDRYQRPHPIGTNRHHSSPFHSRDEESSDTLTLDDLALTRFTTDGSVVEKQTASVFNISEFREVSQRTNVQRPHSPSQVSHNLISRTNLVESDLYSSEQTWPNSESQNHEQLQSVLPTALEQNQSGDYLLMRSLPPSSSSELDGTSSHNISSPGQKRSRRRKLETEFSEPQTSCSEATRKARPNAEGDGKPLRLSGRTDPKIQPDFPGDAALPNPAASAQFPSDFTTRSIQEDQRISSRQLQEPDYLLMHQQGDHCHQPNQSDTESNSFLDRSYEPYGSLGSHFSWNTSVVHPQRGASNELKSSIPTPSNSAFPDGFDPVQDLLISSSTVPTSKGSRNANSILSVSKGPTIAKATSHSLRSQEPNDARTSNDYLFTTSRGSALQYSSALSSFSVQSQEVLDRLSLQTSSAQEGHLAQHYSYADFSGTSQQLERRKNVTSTLNQSSHKPIHSNPSELDDQSSIKTATDVDPPESSEGDWYLHSGSHLTSAQHRDLQDFHSNRDNLPLSSQERKQELQRAMSFHVGEETHHNLSVDTSSHRSKMQGCLISGTSAKDSGRHSEMTFSTSGSPRRVTSILWVFKLLDILHNHPVEKHELLVSQAYWFRRWLSKVRLLKMIRQEEKDKWRRAVTHHNISIQQKCLREWMAAVQSRSKSARLLYQHRLLHKGLSAFRFAVMSSKVQAIRLETRLRVMILAKYFSKWSAITQLRKEKEALLERLANQHVTVKAFSVWKEGYHTQQRISIADLHYKVGLLSKFLRQWKQYVAHRRKRYYQTEVARVFHEDRLVKRAWVTMVTIHHERQKARRQFRRSMLCQSWKAWRHGIQIIKIENLHENAKAVVFRDHAVLQRFFADWLERTKVSMMTHRREKSQLSQAFELWKLKHRRRQLLGRILDSKARKSLRKRAFLAWREVTKWSVQAQLEGIRLIQRVQMGVVMSAWRSWTRIQICRRQNLQEHLVMRSAGVVSSAFQQWKLSWMRKRVLHQGVERWSKDCLKRAVQRWKKLVVERRREDKAKELAKQLEDSCLRRSFSKWVDAKAQADHERQRAADMQQVIIRSQLHRMFLAWKLEMMVTRAVGPLTERREKRSLAKAFDSWRDIITRKKIGLNFAERCRKNFTARTFRYWRNQTESHLQAKQEQELLEAGLVQGCFQAWQRLHQREMNRRLISKQRETGCLREAFTSWKEQVEEAELEREIQMGKEQRRLLLQKMFFKAWRRVSGEESELENARCSMIHDKLTASTLLETWRRWRRSLELELKARSLMERNQQNMLEKAFHSWYQYTQQSMSAAIDRFQERLNESCSSLHSPGLPGSTPTDLSPSFSSSSSSSPSSQLQVHRTPSPYASSASPLQELSIHLLEETYDKFSNSVMDGRVIQSSASPGPVGPTSSGSGSIDLGSIGPGSVEDTVKDGTVPREDPLGYSFPDRVRVTPSPLRNLHLGNSPGDWKDADFIPPIAFDVRGQLESGEGSVTSLDQGLESSGQSVESQPSRFGTCMSSVADSGYHANGFTVFSNGESQLEASSDNNSLKSVKDCGNTVDALLNSPHRNNNNSASQFLELSQNNEELVGLTTLWHSSENSPGEIRDDLLMEETPVASPCNVVQNGHHLLSRENGSSLLSCYNVSASSTVQVIQVQHSQTIHMRCPNSDDTSDLDAIGINRELSDFPIGADLKMEHEHPDEDVEDADDDDCDDADEDDGNAINGSVGSESSLLTPKKSTTQFRNLETSTAITNKRAYLTSVILRLRLWPASAAFYQWLEYTRMKKIHRQYRALVEGRMHDAELRTAFLLWRQRSSDNQLAGNFLNKRLLEKCFRTWSSIKQRESKQEEQQKKSKEHASHILLKSAWNTWKEHFLQSLYPIGSQPSWSAHFSQSQDMSQRCASFQAKIQGRNVRECLMFWKLRRRQLREADLYRSKVILKRCLIAWSNWSREKRWREEAARSMVEARRTKMAFQHWRSQLARQTLIHTHYHGAAHNHLCLILRAWHKWAETTRRLCLSQEVVMQRCNTILLKQAWLVWKQEEEKSRRGQAFHDGKILERAFSGWRSVIIEVKQRRLVMESIQSRKKHTSVSACFYQWKMEYNVRKFAAVQRDKHARRLMAEVLATWKMFVAERRCERQKQKEILREAFSFWRNQYTVTKHTKQLALSAATHWRHMVRRSNELTETMNQFRSSAEERRRKQAFVWWQTSWMHHRLADHHHSNRLLSRSMQGLKALLMISQEHFVKEQHFVSRRETALLAQYFKKWKDRQIHMTSLHVRATEVNSVLADRSLAVAFLTWRLRYRERQTEHSYRHKLVLKAWQTWRQSGANLQKAESKRKEREKCLLRQCFNALQNWARDQSGRRIILQCVRSRKNHFTLKTIFAVWRDESRLRQLAKDHHNMCIRRKVLTSWRSFCQKQKVLSTLHQEVTRRVNDRRQQEAFRLWQDTYIATQEAEVKVVAFVKKKEASLLVRCFSDWRGELLELQAQRQRERRIMRWAVVRWRRNMERKRLIRQYERDLEELAVLHLEQSVRREHFNKWRSHFEAVRRQRRCHFLERKYGLIWKQHVSNTLMAQALARFSRLERCWKAWRKCFIRDRVSREMLAQDQQVLLTKVFNKWHQLILPGRTELASME